MLILFQNQSFKFRLLIFLYLEPVDLAAKSIHCIMLLNCINSNSGFLQKEHNIKLQRNKG